MPPIGFRILRTSISNWTSIQHINNTAKLDGRREGEEVIQFKPINLKANWSFIYSTTGL